MTPNPILKVLSTFKKHNVKSLLIGGQACIVYGAAEFSRDSDFVILCDRENLKHLKKALKALKAELIYFPRLEEDYLKRGHACHFRCKAKEVENLRVDVMSTLRGCDAFNELWKRKNTVLLKGKGAIDVIGLEDLVQCKKTQRDKDWFMLKRLVEDNYLKNQSRPSRHKAKWWLLEGRNAEHLVELARKYPELAKDCIGQRQLLVWAVDSDVQRLNAALLEEESSERRKDVEYWTPLKKELETLRHQ